MVPLSPRACKGERERRIEARTGAAAPVRASSSILGRVQEGLHRRVLFVEGVGLLVGVGGVEDGGFGEVASGEL